MYSWLSFGFSYWICSRDPFSIDFYTGSISNNTFHISAQVLPLSMFFNTCFWVMTRHHQVRFEWWYGDRFPIRLQDLLKTSRTSTNHRKACVVDKPEKMNDYFHVSVLFVCFVLCEVVFTFCCLCFCFFRLACRTMAGLYTGMVYKDVMLDPLNRIHTEKWIVVEIVWLLKGC